MLHWSWQQNAQQRDFPLHPIYTIVWLSFKRFSTDIKVSFSASRKKYLETQYKPNEQDGGNCFRQLDLATAPLPDAEVDVWVEWSGAADVAAWQE
jgi:hypothetical protein